MQRGNGTTAAVRRVVIVGGASLTAQCLDLALDGGLDVPVVATDDPGVAARAADHDIPVVTPDELTTAIPAHGVEALLSIAHLALVPAAVLDLVAVAVNFHDGPLPAYAGLDVPSWALWHGEREHAVTWHLMTAEADAGLVVAEERFPVGPRETAFSLNARCYEAALATFPAIVRGLLAGTLAGAPQPDGERRLFRRHDRPTCVVDPTRPAADLAREVRALSLGSQAVNSMGVAHLVGPAAAVVVTDAVAAPAAGAAAGTVTRERAALRLATVDGDLVLDALETPEGRPLEPDEALDVLGLAHGATLPAAGALSASLAAADERLVTVEAAWRDRLRGASTVVPPALVADGAGATTVARDLPAGVDEALLLGVVTTWSWRTGGGVAPAVGVTDAAARAAIGELAPLLRPALVLPALDEDATLEAVVAAAAEELDAATRRGPFLADLVGRDPALRGRDTLPAVRVDLGVPDGAPPAPDGAALVVAVAPDVGAWELVADVPPAVLERVADQLEALLVGGLADPARPVARLPLLGDAERALLDAVNATDRDHDRTRTLDAMVATQVGRTPDAPAVSSGATTLTYAELWERAGGLAGALVARGVAVGDRVGIAVERSTDLVVALLAVLRAGAAYVPLDPAYPSERLALMVEDSGLRTVVGDGSLPLADEVAVVRPDAAQPDVLPSSPGHGPADLAYTIYTSGSTGRPKGVLLEHRSVVNFFVAMDDVLAPEQPGTWLAVTSLSFDISVLELLWTLTRGFHVVVQPEQGAAARRAAAATSVVPATLSLFYFAAGEETAGDGYRLLLDSARWADAHGFEAVWTPERHFHAFGGAYPNPSVISAALAASTEHVRIRSGSVVAPLHNPARIAEEWSVVDNLSGGRVGISFAPGWQMNDFVLNPGAWATAREDLADRIDTVRRLWRGETVTMPGPDGDVDVRTLPRPVQPELPVWLTSAGTPSSFERAGRIGVNLLTHLLGQSIEQLTENIARYRTAWDEAGHAGSGQVTLMLHTYLDEDEATSKRTAFEPMKDYLRTATGLLRNMASSFPTLSSGGRDADEAFRNLSDEEMEQLLEVAAHRYLDGDSGLFGTVEDAVDMVRRCSTAGVDEVACLVDFGVGTDDVLASLPRLGRVREQLEADRVAMASAPAAEAPVDESFAGLVARHGVTHVQCTPSLATMLVADPADREALRSVDHLLLGGEALPTALAAELRELLPGRLTNMYGPTETTIWSLVHEVDEVPQGTVPIGRPIANTTIAVLDPRGEPVAVGAWGELHIAGEGVARGYHAREELTAARFVERGDLGRAYATGDVVRVRGDGVVEFAGRTDHQVKIRGHRIELGEIETVLDRHPDVVSSVVVAHRRELGDPLLVAFLVTRQDAGIDAAAVRALVGDALPEAYVPGRVVVLDGFPLTPNGKTDRGRLVADVEQHLAGATAPRPVELEDDTERLVAEVWAEELGAAAGPDDNFFEIGGNSLLAVAVFRRLADTTSADLALTDVFRHPTIRSFAAHLARVAGGGATDEHPVEQVSTGADRGAMRRRARARR